MLTYTIGLQKEETVYDYYEERPAIDTQELLDFHLKNNCHYKVGDFLCPTHGITNYFSIFVVTKIFTKIEEYKKHYEKVPPLDYFEKKCLGVSNVAGPIGGQPGPTGYTVRSSQEFSRLLTEEEKEKWVNVDVQTKLKEWGLLP